MARNTDGSEADFFARYWKMTLAGIITIIPVALLLNVGYVDWHDARYALKAETYTLAAGIQLSEIVANAEKSNTSNSEKLDSLSIQLSGIKIQGAVSAASALRSDVDRLESEPDSGSEYRLKLAKARQYAESAEAFKNCLLDGRPNCDSLRGW